MSTPEPGSGGDRDRDATEIDASFAEIIAGWGTDEPSWPPEEAAEPAVTEPEVTEPAVTEPEVTEPEVTDDDQGHYEPPEPPPIPRPRAPTLGALIFLAIGMVLLFIPGIVGLNDVVGFPLGLVMMASGLFWLFMQLRTGPPTDSGWDDGSRL